MKMVQIDLSPFPPETQEELRKKLLALAWNRQEPIEEVFPELAPHLTYQ